ncbi:MAG: ABC transporter ATP-binding protein [Candidatus Heimdallarchaeota archaeon]|nr:MAG: ABC transporter ATP-binding protein [Candidatus Heimdallarchaeota archaeon]
MNSDVIKTFGLSKNYNGVKALQSLDLRVPKNSIFGFLGPNGAGKTTAMKILLGLIKSSSGTGTIFGKDIATENIDIRARTGYLPQNFDIGSLKHLTAREVLRFAAKFYFKGPEDRIEERIQEMLELVGLEEKADRSIEGFSGGEKQRLGIAQAQINYPDLLILDEPTAALDPIGRRDVLEVMERLRKYTTIFYSTHILDDVQKVSDSVAILNNGKLVAQGPIDELLAGTASIEYIITLKGDSEQAHRELLQKKWVAGIKETVLNGKKKWKVKVTNKEIAERELLRIVHSTPEVIVTSFHTETVELEDVFLKLVED